MKEILDSKENKAAFVKARPIIEDNAMLIDDIKEAIAELKLVRQSKLQARPARDLISELFSFHQLKELLNLRRNIGVLLK